MVFTLFLSVDVLETFRLLEGLPPPVHQWNNVTPFAGVMDMMCTRQIKQRPSHRRIAP